MGFGKSIHNRRIDGKLSVMNAAEYFAEKAKKGSREKYDRVLLKVSKREPLEYDKKWTFIRKSHLVSQAKSLFKNAQKNTAISLMSIVQGRIRTPFISYGKSVLYVK